MSRRGASGRVPGRRGVHSTTSLAIEHPFSEQQKEALPMRVTPLKTPFYYMYFSMFVYVTL